MKLIKFITEEGNRFGKTIVNKNAFCRPDGKIIIGIKNNAKKLRISVAEYIRIVLSASPRLEINANAFGNKAGYLIAEKYLDDIDKEKANVSNNTTLDIKLFLDEKKNCGGDGIKAFHNIAGNIHPVSATEIIKSFPKNQQAQVKRYYQMIFKMSNEVDDDENI